MRKTSAVATVVAMGAMALVPVMATAAPSVSTSALCAAGDCSISDYSPSVVTEGDSVSVTVTGAADATIDVAAFTVVYTADGSMVSDIVKVSDDISVTLDAAGSASVDIPVDVLSSPATGGAVFFVQPADITVDNVLSGELVSPDPNDPNTDIALFGVRSDRAQDQGDATVGTPSDTNPYVEKVGFGLDGDVYRMEMCDTPKPAVGEYVCDAWSDVTTAAGTIGPDGTADVEWMVPDGTTPGDYRIRLVNASDDINDLSPESNIVTVLGPGDPTPTATATTATATATTPTATATTPTTDPVSTTVAPTPTETATTPVVDPTSTRTSPDPTDTTIPTVTPVKPYPGEETATSSPDVNQGIYDYDPSAVPSSVSPPSETAVRESGVTRYAERTASAAPVTSQDDARPTSQVKTGYPAATLMGVPTSGVVVSVFALAGAVGVAFLRRRLQ